MAATRPKTLLLAVNPVLAGVGFAWAQTGEPHWLVAAATLVAATAVQVGTNLHNDAVDFERGTDTPSRLGPPRASAEGWFTPAQVRLAAHLAFALAFLLGCALAVRGGWPIVAIGLGALACGYGYTSGPRPIAYGPFGELYVLAFFGLAAVVGSHYLQTLMPDRAAVMMGLALGLPAAAVLLLNNYRDLETDEAAGRRTLCHYLGRPGARRLYTALVLLPLPILFAAEPPGIPSLVLAALPVAGGLARRLYGGASGAAINPLLGGTAVYQTVLVLLLLGGLAASAIA